MKRRAVLVFAIIYLCFACQLEAKTPAKNVKETRDKVAFLHEWVLIGREEKLKVEIAKLPSRKGEILPPVRLRIFDGAKVLYSKDEIGIEPLYIMNIDRDKLLTVWRGYSPFFSIRIFGFQNEKLTMLLKTGSRFYPEIVYSPKADENSTGNLEARIITLTQADSFNKKFVPTTAMVFKWNRGKNAYDEGVIVDWNKRLLTE
ncbi:MAG: hypothetical protein IPK73_20575 [Candidatus Obscuribacter sp.]|nr:hypothetical protein [Candidatus Obscuribacter sp.]MBK9277971.1 hypothetical protein [Candidatus Obscuribacter sp.]HND05346.1 hypothetical protein [Candidatus Obscuribacter sp.]